MINYPIIITLISGLSTMIGYFTIYIKIDHNKLIKYSEALASGVMICVTTVELIPQGIKLLKNNNSNYILGIISITIGMILPIIINKTIKEEEETYKLGILSSIAIIMHNIPEGIITYLTSIKNIKLGVNIAISIIMHNIPEGIVISLPIYIGTKNKKKALIIVLISALSEPLGALLTHIFIKNIITDKILGITLLIVGGIMSYLSMIKILPKSLEYKEKKKTIFFFILGIIIMYISVKIVEKI